MRVIFADLPTSVHEMLMLDAEGFYTIMLNSRDSAEDRRTHYQHAISHIHSNDYEKFEADKIEKECHEKQKRKRKNTVTRKWHGEIYETD